MVPVPIILTQQFVEGLAAIQPEAKSSSGHLDDIFYGWFDTLPTLAKLKDDKQKWLPTFPPRSVFEAYTGRTVPVPSIAIVDEGTESSQLSVGDYVGTLNDPSGRTGDVFGERLTTSITIVITAAGMEELHALQSFVHWVLLRNRPFFAKAGIETSRIGQASSYIPEVAQVGIESGFQKSLTWSCDYNDYYVSEYPLLVYDGSLGYNQPGDGGTPWTGAGSNQTTVIATTT